MARLITCGWESGHLNEIGTIYILNVGANAAAETISTDRRSGNFAWQGSLTQAVSNSGACARAVPLPGNPSEIWIRCGVKRTASYAGGGATGILGFLALFDGATRQLTLGFPQTDNSVNIVYRGATVIDGGGAVPGTWQCLELHVIIHSTNGVVQLWLDGALVVNFSGNTQNSENARITTLFIGPYKIAGGGGGLQVTDTFLFDDLAINDTTGSINTGRIGQGGIFPLFPSADTADKDFTRSAGSDNYSLVNTAPPRGDASYVQGSIESDRDLYELANLAGFGAITAVGIAGVARAQGGSGAQLTPTLLINSTTSAKSAWTLTGTYQPFQTIWEVNPETSDVWSGTAVNSLLIGVTVE